MSKDSKSKELVRTINLLKKGDRSAFKDIYDQFYDKLYYHALRVCKSDYLAEEVIQDTFVSLWTNRAKLDQDLSVQSYLFTIVRNKLLNLIKKASREESIEQEMIDNAQLRTNSADQDIQFEETSFHIQQAIEQLPAQRQQIFRLTKEEGFTYDEISKKLGVSRGTVNTQMMRSLKAVKEYLTSKGIA